MTDTYHLCMATDLESYSGVGLDGHRRLQEMLFGALQAALRAALGPDLEDCKRQPQGDGELTVLPSHRSDGATLRVLLIELILQLARANDALLPDRRARVRIGLEGGHLGAAPGGHAGDPPIAAFRLCNAEPVKAALAASAGHYAVVASDYVYRNMIRPGFTGTGWQFRQIPVSVKEYSGIGWLHVPDETGEAGPLAPPPARPDAASSPRGVRSAQDGPPRLQEGGLV
ncbi:hypothetical protein [Thermomonospora sp. CIF 1]|uniref:hypothetical protein n=1 Tax=Thermomonospora sp. CIF 1 TaxID=1916083 RepID=UPI000CC06A25|nr:hypothetical protein [Thermomonospora sp. CIF 1]PKK15295.1 MAG: hypothetical protein BUE48_005670 [Thermomonospora sp. CIF 1]